MRLTDTSCESEPELAVIVICDVAGVGELGGGAVGDVGGGDICAALFPLLHPVIIPAVCMNRTMRIEPRTAPNFLRRLAKPRNPSGRSPAKAALL